MTANPSDQPESATDETTESSTPPSAPPPEGPTDTQDPADTQDTAPAAPDASAQETGAPDATPEPATEVQVADAIAEAATAPIVDAQRVGSEPDEAQPEVEASAPDAEGSQPVDAPPVVEAERVGTTPDDSTAEEPPAAGGDAATAEPAAAVEAAAAQPAADGATGQGSKKKKRKGNKDEGGQDGAPTAGGQDKPAEKKKPAGPDPVAITKQIGRTSEAAIAYVANPDPKLARMSRKHRETIITEIPPVTAGALLGPEALCRHFLASAASGRYRDLFFLWELFVAFPEECKPVLASRQRAQEKARAKLRTATHLGLLGHADRVAEDIDRASGLPWRWMQEILEPMGPAIRQRPVVLAAVLRRLPDFQVDVPEEPSDRWLAEAAALKESGAEVPAAVDALLGANADRLPATVATLSMAQTQYPDRVPALIDRVDLAARDIGAIMAWARDHGHGEQLTQRIAAEIDAAAEKDRATGLSTWKRWQTLGVDLPMPQSLATPTLEGLDLGRPESAELIKVLVDQGAELDPQKILDDIAEGNRMLGEKAFEAFVCAGFNQVHLPLALEGNPMVRPETRCQACQAWTWVRPGHETRCPRLDWSAQDGVMSPDPDEDASAVVDAAVASIDPGGWSEAADSDAAAAVREPSAAAEVQAQPRPTPAPPAPTRPAPAEPAPQPQAAAPQYAAAAPQPPAAEEQPAPQTIDAPAQTDPAPTDDETTTPEA